MTDTDWLVRMPRKIVLYYLILSGLMVYFTITVLDKYIRDVAMFSRIVIYKQLVFIAVTALFLYLLLQL